MELSRRELLDRVLMAEARVEELERELADARLRVRAAVGADPTTAVSALGYINRCERAEELLALMLYSIDQGWHREGRLPDGWEARARAQVQAAKVARRKEEEEGFRRPDESAAYWTTTVDERGRRSVVSERRTKGS